MSSARHATRADAPALGGSLAGAFALDPLWGWIVDAPRRWERWAPAMFTHEVEARLRMGHTYTTDDRAGVAMWAPPGLWRAPTSDLVRSAVPMARLTSFGGARRGISFLRAIERAHPRDDHWYLAVLGTDPGHQGQGVGSRVMAPVLARCDLDGTGAYLESSNAANVPFYERHGFRVTDEVSVSGSPAVALMWRDPHPPGDA